MWWFIAAGFIFRSALKSVPDESIEFNIVAAVLYMLVGFGFVALGLR